MDYDPELDKVLELLHSASIQVAEAADSLRRYGDTIDMDPARRDWVEERLDAIQGAARKHRVTQNELPALLGKLQQEFEELSNAEERGRELEERVQACSDDFMLRARILSKARRKAARSFAAEVSDAMKSLGMPGGVFEMALTTMDAARPWGIDAIEFLISANPGQAPQPLSRIASGGELSRMSLAIQVIASDGSPIPTMVFDEVDSGVGGGVAEMVGRRLQELGVSRQVLCVTHLPQVASLANQHLRVSKVSDGKSTRTNVQTLDKDERVEELARMLGGVEITRKTLAHAAEMLAAAPKKARLNAASAYSGSLPCLLYVKNQAVVQQLIAIFFGDRVLQPLDLFADEFDDVAGLDADHVIVMLTVIEFENGVTTFEIVPRDQASRFELRQDAIDRREANVFACLQQILVDVLRAEMALLCALENLEDLQTRQSDLQAGFAKFLSLLHGQTLSRYDARLL